jgi:hypothetical protein
VARRVPAGTLERSTSFTLRKAVVKISTRTQGELERRLKEIVTVVPVAGFGKGIGVVMGTPWPTVGVADKVAVAKGVAVKVALGVCVITGVPVRVKVGVGVREAVGVAVAVMEAVGVRVEDSVNVADGVRV